MPKNCDRTSRNSVPRCASSDSSTPHCRKTVALVGNPNTGKTTLFNRLTGLKQRVGHHPGVTVERKCGRLRCCKNNITVDLVDLPGAYSLAASSADEAVVLDTLSGRTGQAGSPDAIVCVIDAKNLQRNLFFASQILELGLPVVVALNMIDLAESSGISVSTEHLSASLGVPVVPIVAARSIGIEILECAVIDALQSEPPKGFVSFPEEVDRQIESLRELLESRSKDADLLPHRAELLQTLLSPGGYHETRFIRLFGSEIVEGLEQCRRGLEKTGYSTAELEARIRYAAIDGILANCVNRNEKISSRFSEKADSILTHPIGGIVILVLVMGAVFQSIYAWSAPAMDLIDGGFGALSAWVETAMDSGALRSLITGGVISGVGGVLIFLPQILVLFLFIAILEDCGYMSRAAFLLDRHMRRLGLGGKSFVPLLSSFACAVPGIMAARTIEHPRDRLLTILVAPLMSCSARLPVYMLLITVFIPSQSVLWGITNVRTLVLLSMYFLGIFVAVAATLVLRKTLLRGEVEPFLLELPTLKWPSINTVLLRLYERGKDFVVQAGTIIFAMTILVWTLGYYPHPASVEQAHDTRREAVETELSEAEDHIFAGVSDDHSDTTARERIEKLIPDFATIDEEFAQEVSAEDLQETDEKWQKLALSRQERIDDLCDNAGASGEAAHAIYELRTASERKLSLIDREESGTYLRQSMLGRMGQLIEPAVEPLGWDWRIGTAAIASFPAREVVIATMGTIFNLGGEQDESSKGLQQTIRSVHRENGKPLFNIAVALSIMVFFSLCCQCGATLAAIRRETNSWRWPVFTFAYMTALAYVAALVTYQLARHYV